MTDVVVVGAGPAGLLLAAELRLAGVDTVVLERTRERPPFCRGFNLNARALDLLARRGLAVRLLAEGWQVPHAAFAGLPVVLGLAGTHTDHPCSLGIPQTRVEELLEEHVRDLGADLRRGHTLRTLRQDADAVTLEVDTDDGGHQLQASYVVGCDGSRSTVRKQAGIAFPGTAATRFTLLGDVELADPDSLGFGVTKGPGGSVFTIPRPGYVRLITADLNPSPDKDSVVTLDLLTDAVAGALGRRIELREPRWLTRFGDAARQAAEYVRGRVLLAGDAAHIHPPAGAIGVNVALDDAFNLGWKLAATVRGTAPAHLLGSYHSERHAAGEHVLANTRAQVLLANPDERLAPLIDLLTRVARHPAGNRAVAETIVGLDTRYETPGEHEWLGRLAPNLAVAGTDIATLLADGSGLLVSKEAIPAAAGWSDRVRIVVGECAEVRGLLLRPDGHTAWVDTGAGPTGLPEALEHWFGAAVG